MKYNGGYRRVLYNALVLEITLALVVGYIITLL